jgi:hypothetical protein
MPLSVQPDPNSVSKVVGGGSIVASKSTPGAFRLVWGNECSCPATGPSCRHRKLVAAYVAQQDAAARPPAAKVNVSAMVD